MNIKEIELTPELAEAYLQGNDHNRPCSQKHVDWLANEMASGRWKFNGDTICRNGTRLIDGQHRCYAVIKSGCSIRVILVEGLDCDVFDTKDCGRTRRASDALAIMGEKHYTALAASLRIVTAYRTGNFDKAFNVCRISNSEIIAKIDAEPELRESVAWCRGRENKGLLPYSIMAAMHYLFAKAGRAQADAFFDAVIDGVGLDKTNAAYLLRERLVANLSSKSKLPVVYLVAITIKSWNAWRENRQVRFLRWRSEGSSEVFPVINT